MAETKIIAHSEKDAPIVTVDMTPPGQQVAGALNVSRRYPNARYPQGVWRWPHVQDKVQGSEALTGEPVRQPAWAKYIPGYTGGSEGESAEAEIYARHGAIFERDFTDDELDAKRYNPANNQKVALQEIALFREATGNIKLDAENVKALAAANPSMIADILTKIIDEHRQQLKVHVKAHDKTYLPPGGSEATDPPKPPAVKPPTKAEMAKQIEALTGKKVDHKRINAADLQDMLELAQTPPPAADGQEAGQETLV